MATTEGTYLKSEDITNNLAKSFLSATGADLTIYFQYADQMVVALAKRMGISDTAQIAMNDDGSLVDPNLKRYAQLKFYRLLFSDKRRKANYDNSSTLSDSSSYDKYVDEIEDIDRELGDLMRDITYATITDTATTSDDTINVVEMRRA